MTSAIAAGAGTVIESRVFDHRGPIPRELLPKLFVKAGATQIDDKLKKLGWSGREPVVVPVVSTEPGSGKILGSHFEVRGLISTRTVKANSIWPQADKDISVTWNFSG